MKLGHRPPGTGRRQAADIAPGDLDTLTTACGECTGTLAEKLDKDAADPDKIYQRAALPRAEAAYLKA